jgi:hypothetical protein
MKAFCGVVATAIMVCGGLSSAFAADTSQLKDQVKLQVLSVGLVPGMPQGFYICGEGHLHIRATVQNQSSAPIGKITVAGKVFDAEGALLGEAKATTRLPSLPPYETTEVNLEFLKVTGAKIQQVKRDEETVVEASLVQ